MALRGEESGVLLCWVDMVLGVSLWDTLEGEDILGLLRCVAKVLGVSLWVFWDIEEAWEVSCAEASWKAAL